MEEKSSLRDEAFGNPGETIRREEEKEEKRKIYPSYIVTRWARYPSSRKTQAPQNPKLTRPDLQPLPTHESLSQR